MVTKYPVEIDVLIEPIWFARIPTIKIGINGQLETYSIEKSRLFTYTVDDPKDLCTLEVHHIGKQIEDCDPTQGLDTAVVIKEVIVNGIKSPKFAWQGVYYPEYPNYYHAESAMLKPCTYLGWNGVWRLDISIPAFNWIHQIENLGWIYD